MGVHGFLGAFSAHRTAQTLGLAVGKARQGLAYFENLVLEDDDAQGLSQSLLQERVWVGNLVIRVLTKDLTASNIGIHGATHDGSRPHDSHLDRKVLETVAYKFSGGPVGIENLATAIGEEADTIGDVYEPYLIQRGFLQRTRQGRIITQRGRQHLGLPPQEGALF